MPVKKTIKSKGNIVPRKPAAAGMPKPGLASVPKTSKGKPSRLSKEERALLDAIDKSPEPLRYDLIVKADRDLVKALILKKETRVRKILRSPIQGTIPREAIREAVIAVKRARALAKAGSTE